MRQLLNTLYVTTGDAYLSLDGETIVLTLDGEVLKRYPLLNFESIIKFGHMGVSPALLGHCARHNIPVCFCLGMVDFLRALLENTEEMLFYASNNTECQMMKINR